MRLSFFEGLSRAIAEKLSAFFAEEGLSARFAEGVLVALSGGADSVFLLRLLTELSSRDGFPLHAVHVNHGIRGVEATRDENFCRALCSDLGVPLTVVTVDVPAEAERTHEGLETVARRLRYEALYRVLSADSSLSYIATAHNATDHLETVLQHLLRGGGANALLGIRPCRDRLLRPLLCLTGEEIREAMAAGEIAYMEDSTNADTAIGRNYLRHEILPLLSRLTPSPEAAVLRMSESLAQDVAYLDVKAEEALFSMEREERGISAVALAALPEAILRRLVRRLYEEARRPESRSTPIEHTHIRAIIRLIRRGSDTSYAVPDGLYAVIYGGYFSFLRELPSAAEPPECLPLRMGDNHFYEDITITLTPCGEELLVRCFSKLHKLDIVAAISTAIINGELYARGRAAGDSYVFGGHTHALKKLYNEKKVPLPLRAALPVLCDGCGILWAPFCLVRGERSKECE